MLAPAGYTSFQAGKWWEGHACRCGGFTAAMTHGDPARGGRHGDDGLAIGRQGLKPVTDFIDQAAAAKKPFFVWYAPMMPHTPHTPPERLLAKYRGKTPSAFVAKYWAMCEWFDETVGDLLGHLDRAKLAESTLVVYLHDNGWIQDPDKNNFAAKSKRSPYDGGLRTPIILRWPGRVPPGERDTLASSIDLVPTALTAAGVKLPPELPGKNLLDAAALTGRDAVFGAIFEHNAIDIRKPAANLQYRWVVVGPRKLIVPNPARVPAGRPELYDLAADPTETRDLAASAPADLARLRARLDAWWPAND
jgi:arylsulfatase A-like enzyme